MAKVCEPCGHYSDANEETVCPRCGGGLRLTFLPPPGAPAPAPPPCDAPPVVPRLAGRPLPTGGVSGWLTGSVGGLAVFAVIAVVLANAGWRWVSREPAGGASDATGRIRAGMPMHEVARVIEAGDEGWSPGAPRLTHDFPPGCRDSGTLVWRENHRVVTIDFADGRVTGVRDEPADDHAWGNTGRQLTITYD